MRLVALGGLVGILALPALAQGEDISRFIQQLDPSCRKVSSVNYKSPALVQPRSGRFFFTTGTLRRMPYQKGQCLPAHVQTPTVSLVFLDRKTHVLPLLRHRSVIFFQYVTPLAFSPDGRFLVLRVDRSNGVDLYSTLDVLDTEREFLPLHLPICTDATFGASFQGFVDDYRIQVRCLTGEENSTQVWDLRRRTLL